MSTLNGKSYSTPRNINLRGGILRFDATNAANPLSATSNGLYVNASNQLIFASQGTTTIIGVAGSGMGIPSWEQIFGGDQTLSLSGTTMTINNTTGNNDVLTITNSGGGSGSALQITNVGTGHDVDGSSNTWSVSKAGAAVFTTIDSPLFASSAALTISVSGSNILTIGSGSNTVTIGVATTISGAATFSSTIAVTDGLTDLISSSNTVAALRITNNTVTTWGTGAASAGVAVLRSTSLTTGSLLRLQLTESVLTGTGAYLDAYNVTGTAIVFSVKAKGATVIAGSAYATAALTLTAGDIVVSAGKITQTAVGATTTNGYTGTFNGLTTGVGMSLVHTTSVIASGGSIFRASSTSIDTSTTTGCLIDLSSTASAAGTQVLATLSGLTTGKGVSIVTAALTSGIALSVTGGGANQLTAGTVVTIDGGASTVGSGLAILSSGTYTDTAATGGLLRITAASVTSGYGAQMTFAGLTGGHGFHITGGGANMTTGGDVMRIDMGAATTGDGLHIIGSGTYTDTTHGALFVDMNTATSGNTIWITATGTTSGKIINVNATAATLTTGRYASFNDGAVEVLGIGANGHIHTVQGAAPSIATNSTGISACAIISGAADTAGGFTTTGTPASGTVLTVTFGKTYTTAPKFVALTPLNAAAGNPNTVPYVSSITATTFVITWPAAGTYAATPSYAWSVIA